MTVALIPTISFLCHRSPFSLFVNSSTRKPYSCFCCLRLPMPPSTIVVEYAKSKRSTCKTCSCAIPANALRLGVVSRDAQRGFDMTRWHHLDCFSFDSVSVSSADSIRGFDSLESYDQDALKKLIEKREQAKNRDEDNPIRDEQEITKKKKVKDKDKNIVVPEEQRTPKKVKAPVRSGKGDGFKYVIRRLLGNPPAESEYAKAEAGLAAPDITDKYKGSTLPPKWKAFHTVIFLEKDDGLQDASKIAAFDFDGCLAKTSVKRIGADAWSLMYPSVPDKLQKLYADGFKLVIFTNECNIDRWRNKRQTAVDSKIGRLNNFLKCVSVPMQVFIACGFDRSGVEDAYRKPKAGMWHVMEKHFNSGISVDMDQSFYVGDAAGRENDHSDADIKFAQVLSKDSSNNLSERPDLIIPTLNNAFGTSRIGLPLLNVRRPLG